MAANRLLVLPKLGLTMTEGAVAEWSLAPGTRFTAGQTVFVVESDKAAVEFDAPAAGVFHEILVPAGQTVPVGTEIGKWTLDGETDVESVHSGGEPAPAPVTARTPATAAPAPKPAQTPAPRTIATPLARRQATGHDLDITQVNGTGPRGRIVAADIAAAVQARNAARVAPPTDTSKATGALTPLTTSQKTMAARVGASKREIPHFYLGIDVDVGDLLAMREQLNALPGRPRTSVTHLLAAGVVEALRRSPDMNRVWTDEGLLTLPTVDVGLAVDTPSGLMSPVVRDLAPHSFLEIVRKVDDVIGRARTSALRGADVQGGAITISNAGMHDVRYMTSIIVPGQSAILGVGSVQSCFRPDAQGQPVLRREMGLVLSADHRIHTGVSALTFLNHLKSILQRPLGLVASL